MENLAYQEYYRDELLDGKIIAMSPRPVVNHNAVILNIASIFRSNLKGKACTAYCDGVDVYLTKKDRVVPDVMIVCDRDIIKKNGIYGVPDLIVEVISPSTAKRDRGYKKKLYESCGVKEYWIVEIENRAVEVYLLTDGIFELDEVYSLIPDYIQEMMTDEEIDKIVYEFKLSVCPDISVKLEDIFEKVL